MEGTGGHSFSISHSGGGYWSCGDSAAGSGDAGGAPRQTPRAPGREPNGTFWFGAELNPDGDQVWFRIAAEDIGRMPAETSTARGRCLIDALIVWITPDRPLGPGLNRFQVRVCRRHVDRTLR